MVGWHHINGCDFEQVLGDGEGRGSLMYCSPWVAKSQTWLNNNKYTSQECGNGSSPGCILESPEGF